VALLIKENALLYLRYLLQIFVVQENCLNDLETQSSAATPPPARSLWNANEGDKDESPVEQAGLSRL
jgi:hypothetical protein